MDIKKHIVNFKISVIGSAHEDEIDAKTREKAYKVGKIIAENNCILLTGAGRGISEHAAIGAKDNKGLTVGISPANNLEEHKNVFKAPYSVFDILLFTGFGYKGRNVILIRSCDAVAVINGGIGTLNELTIALDEGKQIGILEETGGTSDSFLKYFQEIKESRNYEKQVISSRDPKSLIAKLINKIV